MLLKKPIRHLIGGWFLTLHGVSRLLIEGAFGIYGLGPLRTFLGTPGTTASAYAKFEHSTGSSEFDLIRCFTFVAELTVL